MYQVKFEHEGETRYGFVEEFSEQAKILPEDKVLVTDAIYPIDYVLGKDDVTGIDSMSWNEIDEYIEQKRQEAYAKSKELRGFLPGKVFSVHVGDGNAYYEVTDVTTRRCTIEWRGYSPDRWTAPFFGYGGRFDRPHIEALVKSEERINALFGG